MPLNLVREEDVKNVNRYDVSLINNVSLIIDLHSRGYKGWTRFKDKIPNHCIEISADILDTRSLYDVPKKPGAYVITTQSGSLYIGSSGSLRNRLFQHLNGSNNVKESIKNVCICITKNRIDAIILEYWLIKKLSPDLNKEFINYDEVV